MNVPSNPASRPSSTTEIQIYIYIYVCVCGCVSTGQYLTSPTILSSLPSQFLRLHLFICFTG
jgi:hypothetical protein